MKIRVYYEDTDAGGIVYHTNYIKYCERARSELFFSHGVKPLDDDKSGFVVHHLNADFITPARLGDMLEVRSQTVTRKRSSIVLQQEIYKGSEKIFSMTIMLAYISEGKVSRIPTYLLDVLETML